METLDFYPAGRSMWPQLDFKSGRLENMGKGFKWASSGSSIIDPQCGPNIWGPQGTQMWHNKEDHSFNQKYTKYIRKLTSWTLKPS